MDPKFWNKALTRWLECWPALLQRAVDTGQITLLVPSVRCLTRRLLPTGLFKGSQDNHDRFSISASFLAHWLHFSAASSFYRSFERFSTRRWRKWTMGLTLLKYSPAWRKYPTGKLRQLFVCAAVTAEVAAEPSVPATSSWRWSSTRTWWTSSTLWRLCATANPTWWSRW